MAWPVRDCPQHECCALSLESGTLCLACGQQVLDTIDGLALAPAPPALIDEARAAWQDNSAVRTFTASARLRQSTDDPPGAPRLPEREGVHPDAQTGAVPAPPETLTGL